MSRKSMQPAHNRHINHGKQCPICNPPKGEWTERWKQKQAPIGEDDMSEMAKENVELIVGNVGTVYLGFSIVKGMQEFRDCVEFSKTGIGRMAGESVTLLVDGSIEAEYTGTLDLASITEDDIGE